MGVDGQVTPDLVNMKIKLSSIFCKKKKKINVSGEMKQFVNFKILVSEVTILQQNLVFMNIVFKT